MLKINKIYALLLLFSITCFGALQAQKANVLTKAEQQNGWRLLFDGKTFNGWQKIADSGWDIKNGHIMALGFNDGKQRDIITTEQFGNFELSVEFKISKLTNSGIKYLVTNNYPGQNGTYLGLEYQILDDVNFKYPSRGEYRSLASLYDLIAADKKEVVPLNKWNVARILVKGNQIEHWLNSKMVVKYDRSTAAFDVLVSNSKYHQMQNFGKAQKGHILLQNEGTPIEFRTIKIKTLM